jgi:hypothetical protein
MVAGWFSGADVVVLEVWPAAGNSNAAKAPASKMLWFCFVIEFPRLCRFQFRPAGCAL